MEKRYQVFISSTYQDLQPARQEVSQALLRADCFPAGMELFPAADEEQFAFIKQIIDQSDYYIIISAGRYGSIHPETGLSYTEMEYDYAVEIGKPVIRLLHKDPFNQLKGEFIEKMDEGRKKLEAFRAKLSNGKLIRYWEDAKELEAEVVFGIMDCRKRFDATGWVRTTNRASDEVQLELAEAKAKLAKLELEIEKSNSVLLDFDEQIERNSKGEIRYDVVVRTWDTPTLFRNGNSKIVAQNCEQHAISVSEILKIVAICCLQNSYENKIREDIERSLTDLHHKKRDHRTDHMVDFKDEFDLTKNLLFLESVGILVSEPDYSKDFPELRWSLTARARPWASKAALEQF